MPDWVATILAVVAGGVISMASGWLADRRINKRDRERRREERRERMVMRRNDFQRETLLSLQVAAQNLLRTTGASLHQDTLAYRTTGRWQKQQLPELLSDQHLKFVTETMLLASRIRDERVRELADQLRAKTVQALISSDEATANNRLEVASQAQTDLILRIGELVRELDGEICVDD
jgi:hypothetical protein